MADEGDQMQMESQSTAGKWILTILAVLVAVGFAVAHYMTYQSVQKLTKDLAASQAQTKELQARMQKLSPLVKIFGAVSGVLILVIAGMAIWQRVNQPF